MTLIIITITSRHHHAVTNHWHLDGLFHHLFRLITKEIWRLRIIGPVWGEITGDPWIPSQRTGNVERVSESWCQHEPPLTLTPIIFTIPVWPFVIRHFKCTVTSVPSWETSYDSMARLDHSIKDAFAEKGSLVNAISSWHDTTLINAGPLFTKKTLSYVYRDPHDKPKTVWRPSQVYNGNPYTDKTASSKWIEALRCRYSIVSYV